jgi:hypothetical protein
MRAATAPVPMLVLLTCVALCVAAARASQSGEVRVDSGAAGPLIWDEAEEPAEIPPEPLATGEFVILLDNGTPAAGAMVREFTPYSFPEEGREAGQPRAFTAGPDGRVTIPDQPQMRFVLLYCRSADGARKVVHHVVPPTEPGAIVPVHLYRPGRVTGELRDEAGKPAADVTLRVRSVWDWLEDDQPEQVVRSDKDGRYAIDGLVRGSLIDIYGYVGPEENPTTVWRFSGRQWSHADPSYSLGLALPSSNRSDAERPVGTTLASFLSGTDRDRWYDTRTGRWRHPVPTLDPGGGWPDPPGGATPIWHAGRPDWSEERYGRTVVFRREFEVPDDSADAVGYLIVNADDYAAIHVNGQWVGQCAHWQRSHTFVIPAECLRTGANELYVVARNAPGGGRDFYNPGGLAYMLELIRPGE